MPRPLRMRQPGDVPGASLTASNALAGRPGKRPRTATDAEQPPAAGEQQQQQQAPQPATGMLLRSAQKRLLAAAEAAVARADSGVGSSQQLDRTDSCGGPRGGSADATGAAPEAAPAQELGEQQPPLAQASRLATQAEASARDAQGGGPPAPVTELQPPPKRRRISRAGVPAPLPSYELRTFERPSPPYRCGRGGLGMQEEAWLDARPSACRPRAVRLLPCLCPAVTSRSRLLHGPATRAGTASLSALLATARALLTLHCILPPSCFRHAGTTTRTGTTNLRLARTWRRGSRSCASLGRAPLARCGPDLGGPELRAGRVGWHACRWLLAARSRLQALLLLPPPPPPHGMVVARVPPWPQVQVLECWDRKRKDYVAVKIIRNIQVGWRPWLWLRCC